MSRVLLQGLRIKNFGPIVDDAVVIEPFTYFVGRNNAGKSHYLKAIETLLLVKNPAKDDIVKLQQDKSKPVIIEGDFIGVDDFTNLVIQSNHKKAIEDSIKEGILTVARILDPNDEAATRFGVVGVDGGIHNPGGFTSNLLKVLPEPISIIATADTTDELKDKGNTALNKLKKEVLITFFNELKDKTQEALKSLDMFLHSEESGERSQELQKFETRLREELMGEFAEVIPSVEFDLPDEEVIAKEMKIFLDDGYRSEIEQKGHGLQRAALLALLRVLAKHGARYHDRPSPIFLIGELESFLHPYAQKQVGGLLKALVEHYQIVTTTHSPFIVDPAAIGGYVRVGKRENEGTKASAAQKGTIDLSLVTRHLERRGNLEGLFADRIILIEGKHDEGFYKRLVEVLGIEMPEREFTLFVRSGGKEELRQTRKFYLQLGFRDVAVICDLDYLFSQDVNHLLKELAIDTGYPSKLRAHIEWTEKGDPSLDYVVKQVESKGEPEGLTELRTRLEEKRVFCLKRGAPEMYYESAPGKKDGWTGLQTKTDLKWIEELEELMQKILN